MNFKVFGTSFIVECFQINYSSIIIVVHIIYVDESGDVGVNGSPTRYFCLSGLVFHELRWHETLEAVIGFRKDLRLCYGLKLREELHAAHYLHKPGDLKRIPKSIRLRILRDVIDFQASLPDLSIINVVVDKNGKGPTDDIFEIAWTTLIQRFHNTIAHKNFSGPQNPDDKGILIVDQTDEIKLRNLSRRMRRYNPVPSMFGGPSLATPITTLVEDAVHRNSQHSYFIQLADVNAYFLFQKYKSCGYVSKKGARNYFSRLAPILCTVASTKHAEGIVER